MSWWRRLLNGGRMDQELDAELRFHFELQVAEKVRSGISEDEARRSVRLEFGGLEQVKEDCRESRGTMWVTSVVQDLRFALRQLRKAPGFAIVAVLALSLGIGAAAAIFSVIDALFLRPLPFPHQERLVVPVMTSQAGFSRAYSYPSYQDVRAQLRTFDALAGYAGGVDNINLEGPGEPVSLRVIKGTDNFFTVFGVKPILGHTYEPGEDQPGRDNIAVLSYQVWQANFAGLTDVVGKVVRLGGTPYTVIGVMPAGFRFPLSAHNVIYTPLHPSESWSKSRGAHWLRTVGLLKEGVNRDRGRADLNRVLADIGRAYPDTDGGLTGGLIPLAEQVNSLDSGESERPTRNVGSGLSGSARHCLRQRGRIIAGSGCEARTRDGPAGGSRRKSRTPRAPDAEREHGSLYVRSRWRHDGELAPAEGNEYFSGQGIGTGRRHPLECNCGCRCARTLSAYQCLGVAYARRAPVGHGPQSGVTCRWWRRGQRIRPAQAAIDVCGDPGCAFVDAAGDFRIAIEKFERHAENQLGIQSVDDSNHGDRSIARAVCGAGSRESVLPSPIGEGLPSTWRRGGGGDR